MSMNEIIVDWMNCDAKAYTESFLPVHDDQVAVIIKFYREKYPDTDKIPFAIDIGCGSGELSEVLAKDCEQVLAIDVSPNMIALARKSSSNKNVRYEVADAWDLCSLLEQMNLGSADLITIGHAAHYFATDKFYNLMKRCLKRGGILAQTTFTIEESSDIKGENYEELKLMCRQFYTNYEQNEILVRYCDNFEKGYDNLNIKMDATETRKLGRKYLFSKDRIVRYISFSSITGPKFIDEINDRCTKLWKTLNKEGEDVEFNILNAIRFSINLICHESSG